MPNGVLTVTLRFRSLGRLEHYWIWSCLFLFGAST
jgi:hypothetical protein